ncbi:MAG: BlaI/MecI/CopY family transcriptional regulator [Planctomycetota bacterium]
MDPHNQTDPEPPPLTALQLALLGVLWDAGEATVNDVTAALQSERGLAPTTVATLLSRLEKRGVVERRREGRQYLYRATIEQQEAQRTMVDELAKNLFEGDYASLMQHLLARDDVAAGDLRRVKALIEERERGEGREGGNR